MSAGTVVTEAMLPQRNHGTPAVGKALDADCPRCGVSAGEKCKAGAPCVERGRIARWAQMLKL